MQKGRARESVRERDTAGCEGNGGVHRDQRVGHLSPLALAGANSNNRARLGERHRTVVTRANPKYCYPPTSVLSRPSALPDSLRSEEESPFLWKIAEKLRTSLSEICEGSLRDSNIGLNPRLELISPFIEKKKTNCFPVFFLFSYKQTF